MPHAMDMHKDEIELLNCSSCINSWNDGLPRGQWPCVTCSQNIVYKNAKLSYLKNHYTSNKIEPISEE